MSYSAAILPSRFWVKRYTQSLCDFCNRKHTVFFLAPCFSNKNNHTISAKFIVLCPTCAKTSTLLDQYCIPDPNTCKILTRHFSDISKTIAKDTSDIHLLSDFVEKFERVTQQGKEELLTKLGKQGRPKCECCGSNAPKARCSGCHVTRYCSQECNEANWEKHMETCKQIAKDSLFFDKIV